MDDELLLHLYHDLSDSTSARLGSRQTYSDAVIALIHFRAVIAGRSHRWAHDKRNWPLWARRLAFPSYSQLMRRVKGPVIDELVAEWNRRYRRGLPAGGEKFCDGKPLVVGGYSHDPDARRGQVPGGWARGYKLHVVVDGVSGAVDAFEVTPLDRPGEPTAARRLLRTLDLSGVLLRGDSNYDSNPLYRLVAERGGRLLAPRKKPFTGIGHHRQHPDRLRAIAELEGDGERSLRMHRRHRIRVEQGLAHLTNLPFGLSPLPNFVRRLPRVRRWVKTKIMLYHLSLNLSLHHAIAA
jgi:hypothetical protein